MTVMEITKRIEKLETQAFFINMVDHWTAEDRKLLAEVEREIRELKALLN